MCKRLLQTLATCPSLCECMHCRYSPCSTLSVAARFSRNFTFTLYVLGVCALAAYFFSTNYIQARTQSFITLDKKSGVCKDDASLDQVLYRLLMRVFTRNYDCVVLQCLSQCCEVPMSVTGTFLADATGKWNSEPFFSYTDQIYGVTMTALQYTNSEWKKLMRKIEQDLSVVSLSIIIMIHHVVDCALYETDRQDEGL